MDRIMSNKKRSLATIGRICMLITFFSGSIFVILFAYNMPIIFAYSGDTSLVAFLFLIGIIGFVIIVILPQIVFSQARRRG